MTDDITILTDPLPDHWDEAFAQALIGKTLLVGLTLVDDAGVVLERQQFSAASSRLTPMTASCSICWASMTATPMPCRPRPR